MAVKTYRELVGWQRAMDLVEQIYLVTKGFPREETYGLTSQIRRAAVSVPSNIAEGQGRQSTKEFINHLSIAYGSLLEVETQTLIAQRLSYITREQSSDILTTTAEIGRLINGLTTALRNKLRTNH